MTVGITGKSVTRDTAIAITITPDDQSNTAVIHSDGHTATARVVNGFRKNPNQYWNPEAVAQAVLDYRQAREKQQIAQTATVPLFDWPPEQA